MSSRHRYWYVNQMPFGATNYYRPDGVLDSFVVRRGNGRFWLNTYRYDTYTRIGQSW